LQNGRDSKYVSWFNIYSFPVVMRPKPNYECWWGYASLPKLMTQNPEVKKHIFEVTEYWTNKGIDGWRLDVPNEVPHEFWKQWRQVVRSINKECYIVGELWQDASAWLQGDEFDATMNYKFRDACLRFFAEGKTSANEFGKELVETRALYNDKNNFAMQNLVGSHDTERYLTMCGGDVWKAKLTYLFQMTYFGAPMIYYGDEIGMEGGKDPDCRRPMIWNKKDWNMELYNFVKNLISLRNSSEVLRRGDFEILPSTHDDVFAFQRNYKNQKAIIVINRSQTKKSFNFSIDSTIKQMIECFSNEKISISKNTVSLTIPRRSGKIFLQQ
jgi:glycosidase